MQQRITPMRGECALADMMSELNLYQGVDGSELTAFPIIKHIFGMSLVTTRCWGNVGKRLVA